MIKMCNERIIFLLLFYFFFVFVDLYLLLFSLQLFISYFCLALPCSDINLSPCLSEYSIEIDNNKHISIHSGIQYTLEHLVSPWNTMHPGSGCHHSRFINLYEQLLLLRSYPP